MEVKETPDTAAKIITAIDTIKVGGTVNAPAYEVGGKVVNCLGDFNTATSPVICTKVTGMANTILAEVKKLTADGDTATVGTVLIESDATAYDIILKKVTLGYVTQRYINDPVIDKVTHKITVEVKETPDTTAKITAAIGTIKVGGTASAPVYDSSGKAVTCPTDFDTATTPVICTKVKGLPGEDQEMDKVLEDLKDSKTINTDNIDALKKMGADKLKDVSTETIDAFTKTVAQNPIDMSGNLDKVLDSYKQIDTATELEVDNFEKSIDCILYNECN